MTQATVTVTEVEVNALRAQWEATCEAQRIAHAANVARPSITALDAVLATMAAERVANASWKAGERALQDMWRAEIERDEEMRLAAMCEEHDAMEEEYGAFDDHAYYTLTPTGEQYLDYHYATHSAA